MDYNADYRVTDLRTDPSPSENALTPVVPCLGGVMFWDALDKEHKLEWDDEADDTFIDDDLTAGDRIGQAVERREFIDCNRRVVALDRIENP